MMLAKFYVRFNAPKPSSCWNCGGTSFTWDSGEWICNDCEMIQHQ